MSRILSVEQLFVNAYLKKLNEAEQLNIAYLTNQVLPQEEYATKVGYLQALKEMKEEVRNLLKAHFPNE